MRAKFDFELIDNKAIVYPKIQYQETMTLDILCKGDEIVSYGPKLSMDEDGVFTIKHIILPTIESIDCADIQELEKYDNIYVMYNHQLWKYICRKDSFIKADINELVQVNPRSKINAIIESQTFISDYYLNNCLDNFLQKQINCQRADKNLLYQRSNLVMFLQMLNYYKRCNNFDQAQALIDQANKCFNFCVKQKSPCGCRK